MLTLSHYDPFTLVFRVQTFQKRTGMLGAQCLEGQWGEVEDPKKRQMNLRHSHNQVEMQATTVYKTVLCKEP